MKFNRQKIILLGPEYETNCEEYNMDHNFRFRSDCVNECTQQKLNQFITDAKNGTHKCIFPIESLWGRSWSNLDKDLKLCSLDFIITPNFTINDFIKNTRNRCEKECRPDCENRYYIYDITNSEVRDYHYDRIRISYNHQPDQLITHLPEKSMISFISEFGGLIGMWIGLSALAILKFVLKITSKKLFAQSV
jgi:hypothetical protein